MYKLLVFAAVLALASANLKELLGGGGDHAHHGDHDHAHHDAHHGEHHGDHGGDHHGAHDEHHGDHHAEETPFRSEFKTNEDGSFTSSYETEDGTSADMSGQNKQIGDQAGIEMRGSYSYISPEGKTVSVRWIANEKGFQPEPEVSE